MTRLSLWKMAGAVLLLCAATAIAAPAQVFNTLVDFDFTDGAGPYYMSLVQGRDGNLYGTAFYGGTREDGTVFNVTPAGTLTALRSFDGADGGGPNAGLVLSTDLFFYGTTAYGGNCNCGVVFNITPGGRLTALYSFTDGTDGAYPIAGLVQGTDGNLYGTANEGGDLTCAAPYGCGTVFKITQTGAFTPLHIFELHDGGFPRGGLIEASDGNFYGTTYEGGDLTCAAPYGCGTVFKITSTGKLTMLHSFDVSDGSGPSAGLIQATDGDFYGTTFYGGDVSCLYGCGTIFKITPGGALTTLHDFDGSDGSGPSAGLIQTTDGNSYGTTVEGFNAPGGTVFEITPQGTLTTLHNFCSQNGCADGNQPIGGLVQATNGILYGTTYLGGVDGYGNIFSIDMGLGPFVTFVRSYGKVGETGPILGQGFTGTTNVSLNGISANFTVVSDTYIRATVPVGATTGYVTVTTSSGTLKSNVPFRVIR